MITLTKAALQTLIGKMMKTKVAKTERRTSIPVIFRERQEKGQSLFLLIKWHAKHTCKLA